MYMLRREDAAMAGTAIAASLQGRNMQGVHCQQQLLHRVKVQKVARTLCYPHN
jgi:hypothetical protein